MGFLDTLKEVITNQPVNLKEPKFVKEFNETNKQIKDLEELLEIASGEVSKKIEQDIKLFSYGLIGEKNVAYELKNSHMPILILHDLYLEYNGLSAQIDYVVIHRHFILVIECKNMVGDIEITSSGDFIRHFKSINGKVYKKEGLYSPIVQNERHVEVIRDILKAEKIFDKNDYGIVQHVVTVANPKAVINSKFAKKELKEHIIKHEQLINKMNQLYEANKNGRWLTEESMNRVADSLVKYNVVHAVDYANRYGISLDSKEVYKNCSEDKQSNSTEDVVEIKCEEIVEKVDSIEETALYKELKEYRLNKSREEKVKPYFLYSNAQLEVIVNSKPLTIEELKEINGFGNVKCEKYGADIIEIIKRTL